METKITTISYNLDRESVTQSITVTLAGYDNGESLTATVIIIADDLAADVTFDSLTRTQIETIARTKTATYVGNGPQTVVAKEGDPNGK